MPTTLATSTLATATQNSTQEKVLFASDGVACAIYNDGANLVFRTASSPYTSWSSATTIVATAKSESSALINADDSIDLIYKVSSNQIWFRRLTKSGSTWTVGSAVDIYGSNNDFGNGGEPLYVLRDASDRLWSFFYRYTGSADVWNARYSTDNGSTWNVSLSGAALDATFVGHPAFWSVAVTGNYLLFARYSGGTLKWRRLDTTGTLTAWSAESSTSISGTWHDQTMSLLTDGTGRVILASATASADYAIKTLVYTPGSNTWGSESNIGTAVQDRYPSLARVGSDVYCVWAEYAASNNFAVVYKKWDNTSASWGSKTTLVASGANRTHITAGANSSTLGVLYTQGTGSPYDVAFESVSFGGATPTYTATSQATAQPVTAASVGTFTPPTYTAVSTAQAANALIVASGIQAAPNYAGTSTANAGASSVSSVGSAAAPSYAGDGAVTAASASVTAEASHIAPVYAASASVQSSDAGIAASGTFAETAAFAGVATVQADNVSAVSIGSHVAPVYTADAVIQADSATILASGIYNDPGAVTGVASVQAAESTSQASAAFTPPAYLGTFSGIVEQATASGSGAFVAPVYAGTVGATPEAATSSAVGSYTSGEFTGAANALAGVASSTASGIHNVPTYGANAITQASDATVSSIGVYLTLVAEASELRTITIPLDNRQIAIPANNRVITI